MRLNDAARGAAQTCVRAAAASPAGRRMLNAVHLRLDARRRWHFWRLFSRIFDERTVRAPEGRWTIGFADRRIRLPLGASSFRLDWIHATSINGHDIEVKDTYESMLRSRTHRPELFIDIGANYGTHSLLFLANGVDTLTFEPNRACHGWFHQACALNGCIPALEPVALGDTEGSIELCYPEQETWLGTVRAEVADRQRRSHPAMRVDAVPLRRLDAYLPAMRGRRTLVKIDTEGHELAVLQGALGVLRAVQPHVIFESLPDDDRAAMYGLLDAEGYALHSLPWQPGTAARPLDGSAFAHSGGTNFIAVARAASG